MKSNDGAGGLRGVLLDMDGVLCDSEPFICEAACRMFLERHGATVQPDDFLPFVGAGEDRYLGGVAAKHGVTLRMPEDKARTYAIYLEIIRGRLGPLPGAVEFVRACRAHGLKTAVATSADRVKLEGNLREIGLPAERFDACITGDDIVRKKPDPEIFLKAAAAVGLPASACVVVEDAPNGIQAAKAAGAGCIGVTSSFPEGLLREAGADRIAADMHGAWRAVESWPGRVS